MRDLLRQRKMRQEAAAVRDGILEVYQDATAMKAEGTEGGDESKTAPIFEEAPYIVLARKPERANPDLAR